MAQKRAFVGAILIATWASEFFTQDVEDMNIWNNEVVEVVEEKKETTPVEQKKEKPRFNNPEYKDLEWKKEFIKSFKTSQDLIDEIEKTYRISAAMKFDLWNLWAENYPDESSSTNTTAKESDSIDDLPF